MTLNELITDIKNEPDDIDAYQVVILSKSGEDDGMKVFNIEDIREDGPDLNLVKGELQKESTFCFKDFLDKLLMLQKNFGESVLYSAEYEKLNDRWGAHLDLPITGYAINDEMKMFALLDFLPELEKK